VESTRDLTVAARNIEQAGAFLDRLFTSLALPEKATRSALAERLREIIRSAGLWDAAVGSGAFSGCSEKGPDPLVVMTIARDLKAMTALEDVLEEVALLDEDETGEVSLQAFLTEVTQGLALATVTAEEPPDAPVVVLDVRQSRALSFEHVFVLGLAEKEFPRRGRRHPFFDDAERRDLRERGVDLADAGHDAEQEMLLFYLAATRARRTLTLSYPSLDAQGRPALASHYLEELTGLFSADGGREAIPTAEITTRDLALDRPRCERELLASAMHALWGPGETKRPDEHLAVLDALVAGDPARPGPAMQSRAAETALAGLAAEWEREHGEAFGPFDGLLGDSEILEELCRRFPREEILSARRLELFGACPFAFLAGEILHLAPLEEPSRDLEAIDLGLIYHDILERFFSAMRDAGKRVTEATLEEAKRDIEKTAADYFADLRTGGRVRWTALVDVERRNVVRDLRRLLDWHAERLADWQPTYFEVTFGARPGQKVQPPGLAEPISMNGPHGKVRLRGRIDRLDLAAEGGPGFQVIDYKTGAAPSHRAMQEGTSFQLPIYLWAAEAILSADERGNLARAFFLPIRRPSESGRLASIDSKGKPNEKFRDAMTRAEKYINNFVDAMRCGRFPVWPREGCSDSCDYSAICRYAEWRLRRKWELHPVPGLEAIPPEKAPDPGEADA
jgi:RecB family exonuclease